MSSETYHTRDDLALLYDALSNQWLRFSLPLAGYTAYSLGDVVQILQELETIVKKQHCWAVGFLAYEAAPAFDPAFRVRSPGAFPCLWFRLYKAPEVVSLPRVEYCESDQAEWETSVSEEHYLRSIKSIKDAIAAGETYQVNYSFRLRGPFSGDPWPLFDRIRVASNPGFAAYISAGRWVIGSASPELFFTREGPILTSRPMKGTIGRGLWYEDDLRKADWLRHSGKNQAENVMIVDMVRNDLGRIGDVGTVKVVQLFDVEKHPTVWQMTSTVQCSTHAPLADVFRALFPPASVTGAPKINTARIIAELETSPRRIYTGTIGFVAPDDRAQFNVAIRTLLLDREEGTAEYGVGGGIVWDSNEHAELEECYDKARVLRQNRPDFCLLETLLWTPDEAYFLIERHLKRLEQTADYFSYRADMNTIRLRLMQEAEMFPQKPHKVRLLVSREGKITLESSLLDELRKPTRVCLSGSPIDSSDPFLYHKTTRRTVYQKAREACPGFDDVILWNERGEITESSVANIVVDLDGRLYTPPLECGLLAGTYRAHLLERGTIAERVIRTEDLSRCSGVYLINSVRKIWEIECD